MKTGSRAKQEQSPRPSYSAKPKGLTASALLLLAGLLILPTLASVRLSHHFDPRLLAAWLFVISAVTFGLYRSDKRRAERNAWRTAESTLHLCELLGGWPAAFLAQRLYWHKISKRSYQLSFWFIIVLYQVVAFDSLQGWPWSLAIARWIALRLP